MPWEDYLGTQLPAGSRLPPNFKTFYFFDQTTGIATSAKTLDTTTAAKLAKPSQVYSSLKGNIDAVAKDTELLNRGMVNGLTWNLFTSPVTGLVGPTPALLKALSDAGIKVEVH